MLLTNHAALAQGSTGRVTSSSGEPLGGVTVWNFPAEKTTTAVDGTFSLKFPPGVLRFQLNGYRPISKFGDDRYSATTVMEKAADALWTPPVCRLAPEWFAGAIMAFHPPKRAEIKRGFDVDYGTVFVRFKKNALRLGYGYAWSWGYPLDSFFKNVSELHERDIEYMPDWPTAEYRGRRSDGSYFRFIGMFMETIEYDHATKEQADYFDAIMDTLCWVRSPYK